MRAAGSRVREVPPVELVPLLEAADLPGDDDWQVLDSFCADDGDDDRFATLAVSRAFDD